MAAYNKNGIAYRVLQGIPNNIAQGSNAAPHIIRAMAPVGVAPPLPARANSYNPGFDLGYQPYGGYGGYGGYGSYGGYGGYSPYGSMGYPYRGGMNNGRSLDDPQSSFIQLAEESSRPAFRSIESIVHTFANVTMMLESTFHAMQTSFRAVIGVAENFNKLRHLSMQIAKYISALTMIKTLYWFCKRVLHMLGLINNSNYPSSEDVWKTAERITTVQISESNTKEINLKSHWPLIAYFALLFGGPYVMYRLFSSIKGVKKDKKLWDPRVHKGIDAIVLYKFQAADNTELSISPREILQIAPKMFHDSSTPGWVTAVNSQNRFGLVPLNYVQPVIPKVANTKSRENLGLPVPSESKLEPIVETRPSSTNEPSTSGLDIAVNTPPTLNENITK